MKDADNSSCGRELKIAGTLGKSRFTSITETRRERTTRGSADVHRVAPLFGFGQDSRYRDRLRTTLLIAQVEADDLPPRVDECPAGIALRHESGLETDRFRRHRGDGVQFGQAVPRLPVAVTVEIDLVATLGRRANARVPDPCGVKRQRLYSGNRDHGKVRLCVDRRDQPCWYPFTRQPLE